MLKKIFLLVVFLCPLMQFGQDFSDLWKGHFSFFNIKDVIKGNNKIYAVSENAIFSYDLQTSVTEGITTVNGLSGETISTIYYSEEFDLLIVGYETGLIEIVFDNDENILTVVDIVDKGTITPVNKRINHFYEFGNVVYVSTNYGVSVYDLERLEFSDTYLIGDSGSQIKVSQTVVFDGYIYAACMDGNGIRKGLVSSQNLIDYQNWQTVVSGSFSAIQSIESNLYTLRTDRNIFRLTNDVLNSLFQYSTLPVDVESDDANLIITTATNVFVYDGSFNLISQIDVNSNFSTTYKSAMVDAEYAYVGTSSYGILKTPLSSPVSFEEIHPDGPLLNIPFSITASNNNLWVTFGDHTLYHNPYPLNSRGISHLKGKDWINTQYSDLFGAKCLNTITINPFNTSQVFISSLFSGLLEVNDEIPTVLHNQTNSGLESLIDVSNPNYIDIRVGPTTFDDNGLLWSLTGLVDKPLKSYNPVNNQWQSYDFDEIISNPFDNNGYNNIIIGDDQTKWISTIAYGVIAFNNETKLIKNLVGEDNGLPIELVTTLALDKRNQLWIGTFRGLRVLYNTSDFFTNDEAYAEQVIILEDGIAQELLFQQFVSDIEVDGSNNKWIGTVGTGLFYLSSDGQETIYHFTTDNSPLPSNDINDVSIDSSNGVVYIATTKGLVSFQSGGSSTTEDLESAYAYPNPVRPGFNILEDKVKIKDISENVNIKITDIEGNLVAEAQSKTNLRYQGYNLEIDGGTAYWNGKNLANNIVASGVYLVMLSDLDTYETKVIKLMVIR
ncbi:ABC transporter substrate-binding protein [Pseudalgibacter alginicilyticus]|uniref:ABC transporter substrate-binding protein n=1 Tax=Pseudalgibacter alginicilyticus TaxID=1736674 RepID=A0A0P0DBI4_9FLAO|nr:hypothetical protein [Pseudalgibacter alginicilyticus]ALJ05455.1 ABC transporter substrate-binding protein [Pseudalgibacter alginicilyticus]